MTDLRTTVQHGRVRGGHAYSRTLHADREGRRSSSTGSSTTPAMPGRAAARPAPTPIRKGPMRRGRCSGSFSSTDVPKPRGRPNRKPGKPDGAVTTMSCCHVAAIANIIAAVGGDATSLPLDTRFRLPVRCRPAYCQRLGRW